MSKILIFHHSDLDGIGVKIVGIRVAQMEGKEYETYKCNYNDVNNIIRDRLNKGLDGVDTILIGDISVDQYTAQLLEDTRKTYDIDLMLRDHHATAEWLDKAYEWAFVAEKLDEVPYCGTYLLAREFPAVMNELKVFVDTVDDWDTWKWTKNNNEDAKKLNGLLQVVGEERFTDYILHNVYEENKKIGCIISDSSDLFDTWASSMVEAHDLFVQKTAKNCAKNMFTTTVTARNHVYLTGVVFCNSDISDVANDILDNHPELDILMLVGFPRNISFRTHKELDVPLGDIAKMMTGSGGGHPQAAGSVISKKQFTAAMAYFLHNTTSYNDEKGLYFSPLELNDKED